MPPRMLFLPTALPASNLTSTSFNSCRGVGCTLARLAMRGLQSVCIAGIMRGLVIRPGFFLGSGLCGDGLEGRFDHAEEQEADAAGDQQKLEDILCRCNGVGLLPHRNFRQDFLRRNSDV